MKKLIFTLAMVAGFAALGAYEMVTLGNNPSAIEGKVIAADVASTNAAEAVSFKRIRNVKAYSNGLDIVTSVWTNSTRYFNYSNNVWVATNIVYTKTATNTIKVLALDKWVTNEIVKVVTANNFATSNLVDGAWFIGGDFIFADIKRGDKATVVIEK